MDTPLILFKIEYKIDEFNIPIIEYLLFSEDGKRLNLSGFENISTTFSIPVSIDESKEYLHDPKSDFYNDKCTTYTSEAGTDISIYDRKNDYNKNYLSLCESNCEYKGYNTTNKRIECECNIKTDIISFMNIEIDKDKLLDKFINFKQNSNLFVIYCYKLFFNKNGLSTNLGSYLIIIFIVISVLGFIYFLKFGYKIYKIQISGIIYQGVINLKSNYDSKTTSAKIEFDNDNSYKMTQNSSLSRNYFYFKGEKEIKNMEKEVKVEKKEEEPLYYNDYEMNNLDYQKD